MHILEARPYHFAESDECALQRNHNLDEFHYLRAAQTCNEASDRFEIRAGSQGREVLLAPLRGFMSTSFSP